MTYLVDVDVSLLEIRLDSRSSTASRRLMSYRAVALDTSQAHSFVLGLIVQGSAKRK
jgi:hypothetical protein